MNKDLIERHVDTVVEELFSSLSPEHCYALAVVVAAILSKGAQDSDSLKLEAKRIVEVCGMYARVAVSIRGMH